MIRLARGCFLKGHSTQQLESTVEMVKDVVPRQRDPKRDEAFEIFKNTIGTYRIVKLLVF
jgi:Phage terminase small subunit